MSLRPFHLAIPVRDLASSRDFYGNLLQCPLGRSDKHWQDFDLFGHQLVCHVSSEKASEIHNPVDGQQVPVPHFGVVLSQEDWENMLERLKPSESEIQLKFFKRFEGEVGEQGTMFFKDPSGNALEFKYMLDPAGLFAS